jgi:hypothetical protein
MSSFEDISAGQDPCRGGSSCGHRPRIILHPMKLFVGVTDSDWFEMLRSQPAEEAAGACRPSISAAPEPSPA